MTCSGSHTFNTAFVPLGWDKEAPREKGMAEPDTTALVEQLRAEVDTLRALATRQSIQADSTLHDLEYKLSNVEAQLQVEKVAVATAKANEEAERSRARELEEALRREREERARGEDGEHERREKEESLEREKRELLLLYERSETEKQTLQGESLPLHETTLSPCCAYWRVLMYLDY